MVLHEGLVKVEAPDVTPSTLKWVIDHTLGLTSGDTSGMVDSYGRLSSIWLEWSVAVHSDGVAQRHSEPSLMNLSQCSFDCCGGQVIIFPPRPRLHQPSRSLVLDASVHY
ncbi:hypothetical protein B296_00022423 [Ensete ventricosum]|uniref:Uncharacterized protein n=1 Tax=Ensete ventricosum TaxID=4639 RepID=A0A427AVU5_ENSVE|nr:hypothetical protein B296_00022423 [Ensete ventricosum]